MDKSLLTITREYIARKKKYPVNMQEHVGTQRDEVRRLVFKYRKDIAYLEVKEEDLVRRIQILENLRPTVLVWYMWKVNQAKQDVRFTQWTEEEKINKLHHLETVLKELQTADEIMKKEESILRKRIEELEESLDEDPFANICVKPSSPLTSLTHYQAKSDIALMNKKIQKMNDRRLQFVDFLADSDRDWQKTCEELVTEVNNLRDILDQSNVKLKESTVHMTRSGGPIKKDYIVEGKINDLENQTKSLYKEVIEQEKTNITREESQEEKVFSIIQDAMDEVDSLKQVLKDSKKQDKIGDRAPKYGSFKTPTIHTVTEQEEQEEAETDLGEPNSPIVYQISAENKPSPLVLDFQDKAPAEYSSSKLKINDSLTSSEMAKESLTTKTISSIKSNGKRGGSVEVDTTTDIQLPPVAQVDQLQIGKLSLDNLSIKSTVSTIRASESSVDKTFLDAKKLQRKSEISLTTSRTVGDKYIDPSKLHSIPGDDQPTSAILECFEEMPRSSVSPSQNRVLDSPLSQLVTISSFSKLSAKISPSKIVSPKPTVSKTSLNQIYLPEIATNQAPSPEKTEPHPLKLPDAIIPETTSSKTESVVSETPHHRKDSHKTLTSQLPLSITTPEFIHNSPEMLSKSSLSETVSPRTATAVSKAPPNQISGTETVAHQSHFPKSTSETDIPLKSSSKDVVPNTPSHRIGKVDYKLPYEQTDPYTATLTKSSSPEGYSETVLPPSINPESVFSEATSLKTEKADTGSKEVSPSSLPTPTTDVQYLASKPEEQSSESIEYSLCVIPGNTSESKEIPTSAKLNLGKTGENTITPELYEVPNTDGDFPTSSGLILERQGPDDFRSQPNMDNPADYTLHSKCQVKDHLIKSLADQLREQARGNIWSGNKLLSKVSGDPVKTYDFDRHTLAKYLKGEGPKDIDASLKSNPTYSNTNQLNVEVLQMLDQSSLIIKWGPPPPQEVVGFQIFIDGEFMYWVHSATRKIALLQPLNLSKKLEIAVSPVDSKGKIISRSSVIYTPET